MKTEEKAAEEACRSEADLVAGDILYKQGKTADAFSHYRKAMEKDAPEHVRMEVTDRVLKEENLSKEECNEIKKLVKLLEESL